MRDKVLQIRRERLPCVICRAVNNINIAEACVFPFVIAKSTVFPMVHVPLSGTSKFRRPGRTLSDPRHSRVAVRSNRPRACDYYWQGPQTGDIGRARSCVRAKI